LLPTSTLGVSRKVVWQVDNNPGNFNGKSTITQLNVSNTWLIWMGWNLISLLPVYIPYQRIRRV